MKTRICIAVGLVLLAGCSDGLGYFPQFSRHVTQAEALVVYEGLPHPDFERELFDKESKRAETIEINGHRFYRSPVAVDTAAVDRLRSLSTEQALLKPQGPPKDCGEFHSDWCLVWDNGRQINVHYCFTCGDVLVYKSDERQMNCEMADDDPFKSALRPLRTHRPVSHLTSH